MSLFCPHCDSAKILNVPKNPTLYICPDCKTRHFLNRGEFSRDYYGEIEWTKMASYVNKTYEEIFQAEYEYLLGLQNQIVESVRK